MTDLEKEAERVYPYKLNQPISNLIQQQIANLQREAYIQGRKDAVKWIPVSEPPDHHNLVIVQLQSGAVTVGRIYEEGWGVFKKDGVFMETPDFWMPLPLPVVSIES